MGLLTPAFLAGLAALVVPVLVHLTNRPRSETVPFPSLMFLQRIPYRSVRRQSLRHWLLFALRAAAFALLALAFARPFLGTSAGAVGPLGGARTRVVLLDRSYSMGYGDRWTRAVAAARRALEGASAEDRVALVLFDRGTEKSGEPTADRAKLLALLDAARPGFEVTRYAPALRAAAEMLAASDLPRREVVLITDFQKAGWDGSDDARLPEGTTLTRVDLSDREPSNLAVTGVDLERDYQSGRERVVPSARLVNKGTRPAKDVAVSFAVDGRVVRQQTTSLGANTSATVTFEAFPLPPLATRATVRVAGGDALPLDDVFHLVLAPGGDLGVLVLESGPPQARSLYLERALAIGHRPRFSVEVKDAAALRAEDLVAGRLVVLDGVAPPAGALGRRLVEFVEGGGGLLVLLADDAPSPPPWPEEAAALLGAAPAAVVDRSNDRGGTLAYLDYGHPVFELFRGPHSGDFSSARFFRYRALPAREGVLARFDDGAVALAARAVGKGRVVVWTAGLDTNTNDLPLQPVFLPFVHQLALYAAGHAAAPAAHTVGDALDLSREPALARGDLLAVGPSGERTRVPRGTAGLNLAAPGFYEVRAAPEGPPLTLAAVNADRSESDLSAMDPEELASAVTRGGPGAEPARPGPAPTTDEHEARQALWRYAMVAALVLLATETLLSNRLGRAGPVRHT